MNWILVRQSTGFLGIMMCRHLSFGVSVLVLRFGITGSAGNELASLSGKCAHAAAFDDVDENFASFVKAATKTIHKARMMYTGHTCQGLKAMASTAFKKQLLVVAMAEGLMKMIWEQRYAHQDDNKTFKGMYHRLLRDCKALYEILSAQVCNSHLTRMDIKAIHKRLEILQSVVYADGFFPMDAIAMLIDLIIEQLAHIAPTTLKHNAFENLLNRCREFERYFDRDKTYDDQIGMQAAEVCRGVLSA